MKINKQARSKQMKRGLFVYIPNEYDNLLWKVLKPINISSFDWWGMKSPT